MKFSERMGIKQVSTVIQLDGMDDSLRAGLWNVLQIEQFGKTGFLSSYLHYAPRMAEFSQRLWADYFKQPIDSRPDGHYRTLATIREYFFSAPWHDVYDFVEFCVEYFGDDLIEPLNDILKREISGYRIIDGRFAPISAPEEITAIEQAIETEVFPGASAHLRRALDLLSRKSSPDYRNSIKESISAVESVSCALTGSKSATLGAALKILGQKHELHPALRDGFLKLYGYTSDGDGIRHAMLEEPDLSQADAIYFLVSCSAFVNYLKTRTIQ